MHRSILYMFRGYLGLSPHIALVDLRSALCKLTPTVNTQPSDISHMDFTAK